MQAEQKDDVSVSAAGKKLLLRESTHPTHPPQIAGSIGPVAETSENADDEVVGQNDGEPVDGVEGLFKKDDRFIFLWEVARGQSQNYANLGRALATVNTDLYRAESGLVHAKQGGVKAITNADSFASLVADSLTFKMKKEKKVKDDIVQVTHRKAMLGSETFLSKFRVLKTYSTMPFYLEDFTVSLPGYRDGVLYLGDKPGIADGTDAMDRFLDAMAWATNSDRTNAVAAALTVLLRHHWMGEKPVVLVTGTKSHCGKGTVTDFFTGPVPIANVLYETIDWPMQQQVQRQLQNKPETGVIGFDNVRQDSSGRAKFIRSGFLESLITSPGIDLAAPGAGDAATWKNRFVVTINTNDGCFSPDLLNRSLPIHLAPKGDVAGSGPIGNPKLEYLPAHRGEIEAELRGMIERWRRAGQPLDHNAKHPMIRWARTVGGILAQAGYKDFLVNYQTNRKTADPVKEALAVLAGSYANQWKRPNEWESLIKTEGLVKTLIPYNERETPVSRGRYIGVLFKKKHLGETFDVPREDGQSLRLTLCTQRKREGGEAQRKYGFMVGDNIEQN